MTLDCRYAGVTDIDKLTVNWYTYSLKDAMRENVHIWSYTGAMGIDEALDDSPQTFTRLTSLSITEGHQISLTNAQNATNYQCRVEYGSDKGEATIWISMQKGKSLI